jgi:hypothetical protein
MCAGFDLWVGQKPVLDSQKEPRGKKGSKGYKQAKKGARSLRYLGPDLLESTKKKFIEVLYGRWLGKRFYIITNCILIVQTP